MLLFIALIQFWSYHAIQHLHFGAENDDAAGGLLCNHLFMGLGVLGLHAIHPFTTFLMISYSSNVASTPVIYCIVFAKQTSCHPIRLDSLPKHYKFSTFKIKFMLGFAGMDFGASSPGIGNAKLGYF